MSSKSIGWKPNNFQTEIGFVNLGLAVLGFMSSFNKSSKGFRLAIYNNKFNIFNISRIQSYK